MKGLSSIKLFCVGLAVMFMFTACQVVDLTNAAKVNGEAIRLSEYKYYLEQTKSLISQQANKKNDPNFWTTAEFEGKKASEAAKEKALDELIKTTIAAQKAKEAGLSLDSKDKQDVSRAKSNFIQQQGGKDKYDSFLKTLGMTDEIFNTVLEKEFLKQKLSNKFKAGDIKVTDKEVEDFLAKGQIGAKHILISIKNQDQTDKTPAEQEAAKKKAEAILAKVKAGEDFDKLMKENTEDPGLQNSPDGYVFGKGQMIPEFEAAAFALKNGEISNLVKTQYGYHIIKRDNTAIINQLKQDRFPAQLDEYKKSAKIELFNNEINKVTVS